MALAGCIHGGILEYLGGLGDSSTGGGSGVGRDVAVDAVEEVGVVLRTCLVDGVLQCARGVDAAGVVWLVFDLDVPHISEFEFVAFAVREREAAPTFVCGVVCEWNHVVTD
jgi:hypothetical protein